MFEVDAIYSPKENTLRKREREPELNIHFCAKGLNTTRTFVLLGDRTYVLVSFMEILWYTH